MDVYRVGKEGGGGRKYNNPHKGIRDESVIELFFFFFNAIMLLFQDTAPKERDTPCADPH